MVRCRRKEKSSLQRARERDFKLRGKREAGSFDDCQGRRKSGKSRKCDLNFTDVELRLYCQRKRVELRRQLLTHPSSPVRSRHFAPSILAKFRPNTRLQTRRQSIQWATLTLRLASGGSSRSAALCCSSTALTPAGSPPSPRSSTTSVYVLTGMNGPEDLKEAQRWNWRILKGPEVNTNTTGSR